MHMQRSCPWGGRTRAQLVRPASGAEALTSPNLVVTNVCRGHGRPKHICRASEDEVLAAQPRVPLRVERLLANLGYGKRKECSTMIKRGHVVFATTGQPAKVGQKAVAGELLLDGEPLDPPSPLMLVLHKPRGYVVTSPEDEKILDPKVYDLLPYRFGRRRPFMSCVGRLDKDTSGLLLLTDDGQMLHRIMSPKKSIWKRYTAVLAQPLVGKEAAAVAKRFASGALQLVGDRTPLLPAGLTMVDEVTAEVALCEGRYHQIRRMFVTLGYEVVSLHRHTIGGLSLEDLPEGEWRYGTPEDVEAVFSGGDAEMSSSLAQNGPQQQQQQRAEGSTTSSFAPAAVADTISSSGSGSMQREEAIAVAAAAAAPTAMQGRGSSGRDSSTAEDSLAAGLLGRELVLTEGQDVTDEDGTLQEEQSSTSRRYRDSVKVRRRRALLRQRLSKMEAAAGRGA